MTEGSRTPLTGLVNGLVGGFISLIFLVPFYLVASDSKDKVKINKSDISALPSHNLG
jgi:hypothetical protein